MILGGGESSRLYQKLVKEKEAGHPGLRVCGRPRRSVQIPDHRDWCGRARRPEEVEGLISEEIARLVSEPVTEKELERVRTAIAAERAVPARKRALDGHLAGGQRRPLQRPEPHQHRAREAAGRHRRGYQKAGEDVPAEPPTGS